MNVIREINRINLKEANLGVQGDASWHAKYKDSAYIYVGGLPFDLTEGDIIQVFSQYGEIADCNLVRDKETGKSKGFAFVQYEDQRSTILAVDNLNGAKVLNRTIRVDHVAKYRKPKKDEEEEEEEEQDKESDTETWDHDKFTGDAKKRHRDAEGDKVKRKSEKRAKHANETPEERKARKEAKKSEKKRRQRKKQKHRKKRQQGRQLRKRHMKMRLQNRRRLEKKHRRGEKKKKQRKGRKRNCESNCKRVTKIATKRREMDGKKRVRMLEKSLIIY